EQTPAGWQARAQGSILTFPSATPRAASSVAGFMSVSPTASASPMSLTGASAQRQIFRTTTRVSFAPSPMNSAVEVTPYAQVYGIHPDMFDFDQRGAMQLYDGSAQVWAQPRFATFVVQGQALSPVASPVQQFSPVMQRFSSPTLSSLPEGQRLLSQTQSPVPAPAFAVATLPPAPCLSLPAAALATVPATFAPATRRLGTPYSQVQVK
ncbi:unnamed protein product, partial [Polarella glacialis]